MSRARALEVWDQLARLRGERDIGSTLAVSPAVAVARPESDYWLGLDPVPEFGEREFRLFASGAGLRVVRDHRGLVME